MRTQSIAFSQREGPGDEANESPCTGNVNSVEWSTGVPRPQIYNLLGSTIARY